MPKNKSTLPKTSDGEPMTPSEKKPRLKGEWFYDALLDYDRNLMGIADMCRLVNSRMDEAERRGFERAKELMLEELKTRYIVGPLAVRNLKYEESP